jgi:3-hydroxyisobutyrate dehydrogenase-like beta-hydroxyacid dehydrogenase
MLKSRVSCQERPDRIYSYFFELCFTPLTSDIFTRILREVYKMKVGFIGLGNMGMGMASNVLKAGFPLTINDVRKEIAVDILKAGASWSDTPKSVTLASDIILASLPGPKEVESVALGENGIIEGIKPGKVFIDLSTDSPTLVRRIYDIFKGKGAQVMDAPVSGGPIGARSGKLSLMVGGDEDTFNKCKPVLDTMGDKIKYTGQIGNGCICKLMHNCAGLGFQCIMAECFTLATKAGVDPKVMLQVAIEGALGQGVFLHHIMPNTYFKGKFDPASFALKLAFKDLGLAVSLGKDFNVPMSMSNLAFQEMMSAMNRGWGDRDSCVSMLLQEERAGTEVRSKG